LLAASALHGLTLKVGDAWSGTETVSLFDEDNAKKAFEEDHYKLGFRVIEKREATYLIEVSRFQTESIMDGLTIPALPGGKPLILREVWGFGGELQFTPGDDHRENERLRLERPLHPPMDALAASLRAETGSVARWTAKRLPGTDTEGWLIGYEEVGVEDPIQGNGKAIFDPTTALPRLIEITLENAMPPGGQVRLRIQIDYHADTLPSK
jgi:hypothetical protein